MARSGTLLGRSQAAIPTTRSKGKLRTRRTAGKARRRKRGVSAAISRSRQPEGMTLEAWQLELRRQHGREQPFPLKNLGAEPFFSEFQVANPARKSFYRVAIRGTSPGENFCSCPDFATNALGTCKHIEFTLARLEKKRGGKRALAAGFLPPYSEVFVLYGARREVCFRPGSECPRELSRLAARHFNAESRLDDEAFDRFEDFLAAAVRIDHDLRVYDDVRSLVAAHRDESLRRERLAKAFPSGIRSAAMNDLVKVALYDYQREGALFAARAGRSILADEMGLGKTVQAIAAVEIMARQLGVERVLVVAPTSLKHQWEREIARFAERPTQVISGLSPRRRQQFTESSFYKITNYDTIHRDLPAIAAWRPDLVILDEAQRIKNWNTRAARSVKRIESPYAIVLTGTPLENRLEELASIVSFVDPHRLGPTYRFLHQHQQFDETGRVVGYRDLDRIGRTLAPVLLRRRKDEVLKQLPERIVKTVFVPMTPQQQEQHEQNREFVARVVAKWRKFGFLSEEDKQRLMIALQNMRMSCDSTYLIDHKTDFGVKCDELAALLEEFADEGLTQAVVFSQWTRMHEMVRRRFKARKWDHVLFTGSVPGPQRKALVERFRENPDCRGFLSTDAGGVGLNLQHASVVVNLDIPWNPAILEQRIGRVHRLGQTRPVQVVNFVSQGTIEEGMLEVLAFKKGLAAGILDGGEKEISLGGSRLTKFLETVEQVTDRIPKGNGAKSEPPRSEPAGESRKRAGERKTSGNAGQPSPAGGASDAESNPWGGLLQVGLSWLEELARSASPPSKAGRSESVAPAVGVSHDPDGRAFVTLPMPNGEVLDRALSAVSTLLARSRS